MDINDNCDQNKEVVTEHQHHHHRGSSFQHRKKARKKATYLLGGSIFGAVLVIIFLGLYIALLSGSLSSPFPEWDDEEDSFGHHDDPPKLWTVIMDRLRSTTGIWIFVGVVAFYGVWIAVDIAAAVKLVQATKQNADPRVATRQLTFWKVYWPIGNGISVLVLLGVTLAFPVMFPGFLQNPFGILYVCWGVLYSVLIIWGARSTYKTVERYAKGVEVVATLEGDKNGQECLLEGDDDVVDNNGDEVDPDQHRKEARKKAKFLLGCSISGVLLVIFIAGLYVAVLRGSLQSSFPPEWDESLRSKTGIWSFIGVVALLGAWFALEIFAVVSLLQATSENVNPEVALRKISFWRVYFLVENGIWAAGILGCSIGIPTFFPSTLESASGVICVSSGVLYSIAMVAIARSIYKIVEGYANELEGFLGANKNTIKYVEQQEGDVEEV